MVRQVESCDAAVLRLCTPPKKNKERAYRGAAAIRVKTTGPRPPMNPGVVLFVSRASSVAKFEPSSVAPRVPSPPPQSAQLCACSVSAALFITPLFLISSLACCALSPLQPRCALSPCGLAALWPLWPPSAFSRLPVCLQSEKITSVGTQLSLWKREMLTSGGSGV